jgi:anthranilate synthase component 2
MSKKIYIFDFEDSFVWNIYAEIRELGLECKVIEFSDIQPWIQKRKLVSGDIIVLGPGPGHVDEYKWIFPFLKTMLKKNVFIFGICLGHQLLWKALGAKITRSHFPCHGEQVQYTLNQNWMKLLGHSYIQVQRYNSYAVLANKAVNSAGVQQYFHENELMMSSSQGFLSYQFHPESVGTNFRKAFFEPIHKIFYNA